MKKSKNKQFIRIKMNKKFIITLIMLVLAGIVIYNISGHNDVQNFQVIQSVNGQVRIQSEGGLYTQFFAKIWTYPKVRSVFFSNEAAESKDKDGIEVIFSNKGRGDISSQVVYRLFTDNEAISKMHQYAAGDINIVDNLVLSKLKDISMEHSSNITSSQAVEEREQLAINIRKDMVNNKQLAEMGIIVEQFSITKINFDNGTNALFTKQQDADLQKKAAEAEKQNLIMQKERTEAQADQLIAESKGKADVEKVKAVTDAERQSELARIDSQKKVDVERLAKEEAIIKAQKTLELAEITRKEEVIKLETIKIQAEQKIADAQAKKQEIELSGAMTETQKYNLDVQKEIAIGVASAWANGISKMKLPETFIINGEKSGSGSNVENLITMLMVKESKNLIENKAK